MSFRILSLNGGGIRGIFQAVYLHEIAKNFHKPLANTFQLLAGTSTGALIALGLALEIEPSHLVDMFKTNGDLIFGRKRFASLVRKGAKYSVDPLKGLLEKTYGSKHLSDCTAFVTICSTVLNRYRHRIFTNIKRSGEKVGDSPLSVVDVALASCAAPTYFPSFHFDDGSEARTYVDGGMWANNPALAAIISAHRHLNVPLKDIRLVSLGNGRFPGGFRTERYDSTRPIGMVEDVLELMFSAQNTAADDLSQSLIGDSNVLSIDANLSQPIDLDDVETAVSVLPALAEGEARDAIRKIKDFLFRKPFGAPLTPNDVEIGVPVVITTTAKRAIWREDEGVVEWTQEMNAFRGRQAVVTSINSKGIPSVQLDIDSGKHLWAVEWLTAP